MKDTFSRSHPSVNFAWFAVVLLFSMIFIHPIMLAISLICASSYSSYLTKGKTVRKGLKYLLPLMLLTIILNPIFNHKGATILFWLPSGNPLTMEALLYGIAAAGMLGAVIEWFACFNQVITSDKFVYLFGQIVPSLGLVLSMTLRFVPRFNTQIKKVSDAQKCVVRDISNRSVLHKVHHGLTILSIMLSWALESSIELADSMKSRGYGLPGRTAFSIFRFQKRDKYILSFTVFSALYIFTAGIKGCIRWQYYPAISGELSSPYTVSVFLVWLALCVMPQLLSVKENLKWKYTQSVI